MKTVNVYEAKTNLSQLIEEAAGGAEIVIARAGKPRARLVPLSSVPSEPRRPGRWEGKLRLGADFDDPLPTEIERLFYEDEDASPSRQP